MGVFQELDLDTPINLPSIKKSRRNRTYLSASLKAVDIQLLKDPGCFGEFTVMRATSPPQSIVVFSGSVPQKM
jgi:hypothetical protein